MRLFKKHDCAVLPFIFSSAQKEAKTNVRLFFPLKRWKTHWVISGWGDAAVLWLYRLERWWSEVISISQPVLRFHLSHIWYKLQYLHSSIFFAFFVVFSVCWMHPETSTVTLSLYKQVGVLDRETSRCDTFTTRRVWLKLWIIVEPLFLYFITPSFLFSLLLEGKPFDDHTASVMCHVRRFFLISAPLCSCSSLTSFFYFFPHSRSLMRLWRSMLECDVRDYSVVVYIPRCNGSRGS